MSEVHAVESPAITVRPAATSKWTDEQVAVLKQGLSEGLPYSEITKRIYEATGIWFTRNAAIGKAKRSRLVQAPAPALSRAGQQRRPRTRVERLERRLKVIPRQPVPFELEPSVAIDAPPEVVPETRCSFEDLRPSHCKWPFGTPGTADFYFCGGDRVPTRPYCVFHSRLAYLAPSRRAGT